MKFSVSAFLIVFVKNSVLPKVPGMKFPPGLSVSAGAFAFHLPSSPGFTGALGTRNFCNETISQLSGWSLGAGDIYGSTGGDHQPPVASSCWTAEPFAPQRPGSTKRKKESMILQKPLNFYQRAVLSSLHSNITSGVALQQPAREARAYLGRSS